MKLKQNKDRKKSCRFYCATHKLYYKQECILCSAERLKRNVVSLDVFSNRGGLNE
jgi:hypothetical protein